MRINVKHLFTNCCQIVDRQNKTGHCLCKILIKWQVRNVSQISYQLQPLLFRLIIICKQAYASFVSLFFSECCKIAHMAAWSQMFYLSSQTDYGCDIEKGSVCTYHPGSVHCVRAIQAR